MTRPLRNRDTCERTALAKIRTLAVSAGWPALTLDELDMLDQIDADTKFKGFPVSKEIPLKHNRFGVLMGSRAVVSTGVTIRVARDIFAVHGLWTSPNIPDGDERTMGKSNP
jgi:hypothetical protein